MDLLLIKAWEKSRLLPLKDFVSSVIFLVVSCDLHQLEMSLNEICPYWDGPVAVGEKKNIL